ncbi:uncharacterized protein LOC116066541 [Sander lucioperca]|uniref:uncharacterized protein LOC116066541 n=1 Tax=Sander lucioperca TaxID=283035 RepID=UPI00125D3F06|nr:uncharacterized protein LOC116066541 [Sander lucioperca]
MEERRRKRRRQKEKEEHIEIKSRRLRIHQRPNSAEPEPSCVSFKSDWSNNRLIDFKGQQPTAEKRVDQESSEVPSDQSAQQHQTHLDSIFMLLEEDIVTLRSSAGVCKHKLKSNLNKKFQCVFEGIAKAGNPTLLNEMFTEIYITEEGTAETNQNLLRGLMTQTGSSSETNQETIEYIKKKIKKTLLMLLPVVKASNKAL